MKMRLHGSEAQKRENFKSVKKRLGRYNFVDSKWNSHPIPIEWIQIDCRNVKTMLVQPIKSEQFIQLPFAVFRLFHLKAIHLHV